MVFSPTISTWLEKVFIKFFPQERDMWIDIIYAGKGTWIND
jgi:hypothetical protein